MGIIIQVSGKMIKLMDMVFIFILGQEQNMKVTGKTICSMDLDYNNTTMEANIKECLSKEKDMVMAFMFFQIKQFMMVNG